MAKINNISFWANSEYMPSAKIATARKKNIMLTKKIAKKLGIYMGLIIIVLHTVQRKTEMGCGWTPPLGF
jgi:hypothetical protein